MNLEQLKQDLQAKFLYGKIDMKQLVETMGQQNFVKFLLENTGDPNSTFRENILGLVEVDYLSNDNLAEMLTVYLSPSHLFNGLGRQNDDTVFWRSFSSLAVGYLVETDGERDFLSQEEYMAALQKAVEYMRREVDRRGFIKDKGWGHAVAHGADMLCGIARNPKFPIEAAREFLECIKTHITCQQAFTDGDERRLAAVIPALLEKGLSEAALQDWIESLTPSIIAEPYTNEQFLGVRVLFTIKTFLLALYFILDEGNGDLRKFIKEYEADVWAKAHSAQEA
ncbi:MAG: DUF2785 domain-containing protein [Defluviitaleaceae bacterium]|nr:DUF2785 domain-containing protein [Defluviitaleaceae bacterium]